MIRRKQTKVNQYLNIVGEIIDLTSWMNKENKSNIWNFWGYFNIWNVLENVGGVFVSWSKQKSLNDQYEFLNIYMWVNKVGFGNKRAETSWCETDCGCFVVMSLPAASVTWGSSTSPRKVWWRCWAGGCGRRGRGRKELTTTWQVTAHLPLTHEWHHQTADGC